MNKRRHIKIRLAIYFFALSLAFSGVHATSYVWEDETPSYRIYMGIVPAELVQHQPRLLDKDKQLHNISPGEMRSISHVFVFVLKKQGNFKVRDATVVAEIGPVDGKKSIKPLEKMKLGGSVSYGNFFKVHQDAEHTVKLKVFNPNTSGYEEVVFSHQGY